MAEWPPLRLRGLKLLRSTLTESLVAVFILLNFVVVIVETDLSVDDGKPPTWVKVADAIFLVIYLAELFLRLYVWRCDFFRAFFNVMDLGIVSLDLFAKAHSMVTSTSLAGIAGLRIFRLLQLARGIKVLVQFPQLALLVKGMYRAMSAIFWGTILLGAALAVLGVVAVQLVHPVNLKVAETGLYEGCDRCERSFASVGQSILTFTQQIIAGDSWGLVTIPIIEEQPLSAIFFALVFVIVSLAITNVILSVIVDTAMKASQDDIAEVLRAKSSEMKGMQGHFRNICSEMDIDMSGDLTFEEIMQGYRENTHFHNQLEALDVREDDLELVFKILDKDVNGTVNYDEFTEELFRMKSDNMHTILVFIRFYVLEIRANVQEQLRVMKSEIFDKLADTALVQNSINGSLQMQAKMMQATSCLEHKLDASEVEEDFEESLQKLQHAVTTESLHKLQTAVTQELVQSLKDRSESARGAPVRRAEPLRVQRVPSATKPETPSKAESACSSGAARTRHPSRPSTATRVPSRSSWAGGLQSPRAASDTDNDSLFFGPSKRLGRAAEELRLPGGLTGCCTVLRPPVSTGISAGDACPAGEGEHHSPEMRREGRSVGERA